MALVEDKDWYDLADYLLYDKWTHEDAINVLSFTNTFIWLQSNDESNARIRRLWEKTDNNNNFVYSFGVWEATPQYFIDWALSKRITPEWLDWAIENGLYIPQNKRDNLVTKIGVPITLDKDSPTYPSELDIAMKAWQAVSTTEGKGKPKARIRKWLDDNHQTLSNEAKERIAIVANWDKTGGATST